MRGQRFKAVGLALLGAALMISATVNSARAGNRATVHTTTYEGQGQHYSGKRGFSKHRYYGHGNAYQRHNYGGRDRRLHQRDYYGYKRGVWRYGYFGRAKRRLSYRQWGQHCRPTKKIIRGVYGTRTLIGGTLCFDRHGTSYIVPGSRYRIE